MHCILLSAAVSYSLDAEGSERRTMPPINVYLVPDIPGIYFGRDMVDQRHQNNG